MEPDNRMDKFAICVMINDKKKWFEKPNTPLTRGSASYWKLTASVFEQFYLIAFLILSKRNIMFLEKLID